MMLVVLGLIDVVMISNLLIMVIVGGYETFVSRMDLEGHPDQPEWLSHVNASVLKVKLATAIIGISSIHLLKTFINAAVYDAKTLICADDDPRHVPALRARDRGRRPHHADAACTQRRPRHPPARRPLQRDALHDHDPPGGPDPERRRRAAVHLLLPPAGLHPGARRAPTRASSRRRRRTRSRRSSPIRACAPKATGRSARTRASSSRS